MKQFLAAILGIIPGLALALPGDEYDFNFDGHMDYRVRVVDNAKASAYDVFLFNPVTTKYDRDPVLRGVIYPEPDAKTREVHCIFNGGHSGALFTGEAYRWNAEAKKFTHAYTMRRSDRARL